MSKERSFIVYGTPVAKSRARFGNGHHFTPKRTREEQARVAQAISSEWMLPPLTGAVVLDLVYVFERPKSHYRTGRYSHLLKDNAPKYHIIKPDRDNLEKLTKDAMTTAGVWKDDCQVVAGSTSKRYGAEARVEITIRELPE